MKTRESARQLLGKPVSGLDMRERKDQPLLITLSCHGGINRREIGELMGVDYSAVSVMRKRLSAVQKKDRKLSVRIEG